MGGQLSCSWELGGEEVTVRIAGEIDLANVAEVLAVGRQALSGSADQRLELDLRGVTFIDSAGMGALVNVVKSARAGGRRTRLWVRAPSVVRTLSVMGLMKAFDVQVDPV